MAQQYRVQAPRVQGPEALRPAPIPSDTFTGAPRPVIDNNAANIADALGAFNKSLLSYGTAAARANAAQQKQIDEAAANQIIGTTSNADFIAGIKEGRYATNQSPYYQAVINSHFGQVSGYEAVGSMQSAIRNGDFRMTPDTPGQAAPDVNNWITEQAKPYVEALASNPVALKAFTRKLDTFRETATLQQQKALDTQNTQWREGIATDNFNKVFNLGFDGAPTHNFVRSIYNELGPGTWANLSYQQLDQKLADVVANRANDPQTALAALHVWTSPRTAKDGTTVPSLADNPRFAAQSQQILSSAQTAVARRIESDTKNGAVAVARDALERKDGSFWSLADATVNYPPAIAKDKKNFTVVADDARKAAVTSYLTDSRNIAQQRGETPEQTFNRESDVLISNNVANPVWKDQLEGAAKSLANPAALTNPQTQMAALGAFERFRTLAEKNYPYVSTTLGLSKDTLDTMRVYKVAVEEMGMNPQRALVVASQASQPANEADQHVRAQKAKDVQQMVKNMWDETLPTVFGTHATPANQSTLQTRVMNVASVLVRVPGLSLDEAVKFAVKDVAAHTMVINGFAVPDVGALSKQQQPYIEKLLGEFAKVNGVAEGIDDPSKLTVHPINGGAFQIWDHSDGYGHPVFVKDPKTGVDVVATITPKMISAAMEVEKIGNAYVTQSKSDEAKDASLLQTPNAQLTPEQIERKQAIQAGNRDAIKRGFIDAGKGAALPPGALPPEAGAALYNGVKEFAKSATESIQKLLNTLSKPSNKSGKHWRENVTNQGMFF